MPKPIEQEVKNFPAPTATACADCTNVVATTGLRPSTALVIAEVETCPRMPEGVARPPGLAGIMPGRRLDEIMLETREPTGLS
jgi:hypothetical protein